MAEEFKLPISAIILRADGTYIFEMITKLPYQMRKFEGISPISEKYLNPEELIGSNIIDFEIFQGQFIVLKEKQHAK